MKTKTVIGIILILFGVIYAFYLINQPYVYDYPISKSEQNVIFYAIPSVVIGILFLFSTVGAITALLGLAMSVFLSMIISSGISLGSNALALIAIGIFIVGILYGVIEGIIKLVKKLKK